MCVRGPSPPPVEEEPEDERVSRALTSFLICLVHEAVSNNSLGFLFKRPLVFELACHYSGG